MIARTLAFIAGLAAAAAGSVAPALAQFYKGHTVTMIINYPAGGPSDIEGRIVATNQLAEAAPNGDSIGFFTLDIIAQLLGNPSLRANYADFVMIAGVEN